MPHLKDQIGFSPQGPAIASAEEENRLREFVNLKLASRGYPIVGNEADYPFLDLGRSLIASFQEKTGCFPITSARPTPRSNRF